MVRLLRERPVRDTTGVSRRHGLHRLMTARRDRQFFTYLPLSSNSRLRESKMDREESHSSVWMSPSVSSVDDLSDLNDLGSSVRDEDTETEV